MGSDFAVFILTNGRANNIKTLKTLKKGGYTGKTYIIIDNLDKQKEQYIKNYGLKVCIFDKENYMKKNETFFNKPLENTILYARNAAYDIAKELKIKYFVQLDDDYGRFTHRFTHQYYYNNTRITVKNLDKVFEMMLTFLKSTSIKCIALGQGGDYMGGMYGGTKWVDTITLFRKAMNSFFCKTGDPINFVGVFNEDVNTYVNNGTRGELFFTFNGISLDQEQSQSQSGGITELYLEHGTYVKSFYSVMSNPSCVKIDTLNERIHHRVSWNNAVPKILRESIKK